MKFLVLIFRQSHVSNKHLGINILGFVLFLAGQIYGTKGIHIGIIVFFFKSLGWDFLLSTSPAPWPG